MDDHIGHDFCFLASDGLEHWDVNVGSTFRHLIVLNEISCFRNEMKIQACILLLEVHRSKDYVLYYNCEHLSLQATI